MLTLCRTVRFAVNAGVPAADTGGPGGTTGPVDAVAAGDANGYAGVPAMRGLGRHYELDITCRGEADPRTGYFLDIKRIDRAARETIVPAIARACERTPQREAASLLGELLPALNERLGGTLAGVRWRLSPFLSVEVVMSAGSSEAGAVLIRQRFEFAAAHRLHVPALSDEENRRLFGKCNHPAGHGHNYVVEPCVRTPAASPISLAVIETATLRTVIDYFDHKHLNVDLPEFSPEGGVNPSVENIARVCFERLGPAVSAAHEGSRLRCVTVWETEKTSATYPAPDA